MWGKFLIGNDMKINMPILNQISQWVQTEKGLEGQLNRRYLAKVLEELDERITKLETAQLNNK